MNVLLLHLPRPRPSYLGLFTREEPLVHLFLGPVLRPAHAVRFVDLRLTPHLARELADFRPDVAIVGVGPLLRAGLGAVLGEPRTRFPAVRILLVPESEYGNSHVTERPFDFACPLADALVPNFLIARLRQIVPAVVQAWADGRTLERIPGLWLGGRSGDWTSTTPVANTPGDIGVPDRQLLGKLRGRYRFAGIGRMAHVFYTFGCKFKCRFCPMSKHDGSIVMRSLDEVIEELRELREPNVFLQDYEPFLAPEAMARLADAVEREGIQKNWYMLTRSDTAIEQLALIARWKKLGLRWLYLGLDGFSADQLRTIHKSNSLARNEEGLRRMRELGLSVAVGFVVSPDFDRDDFAALRRYVSRLRPPLFDFTVETPLVGTTLFDQTESTLTTRDWSLFDLNHAVLPTKLPLAAFYREMTRLHWMAGLRSLPTMARHYPQRDLLRNMSLGVPAYLGSLRAAHDHARVA